MKGVRWREEGWEGRCEACLDWWPLDLEFWQPRYGTRKCKACHRDRNRLVNKEWRLRTVVKSKPDDLARRREIYHADGDRRRARQREGYARLMEDPAYRDARYAKQRAYYAARRARVEAEDYRIHHLEYKRDWQRAKRAQLRRVA